MIQSDKFETLLKQSSVAIAGSLVATSGFASTLDTLTITDINVSLTDNGDSYQLDLDGDGYDDFSLYYYEDEETGEERADIRANSPDANILTTGKFFLPYKEGDTVPGDLKARFQFGAGIYSFDPNNKTGFGPLAEPGSSAYIGLALGLEKGLGPNLKPGLDDVALVTAGPVGAVAALDIGNETLAVRPIHFGWLEVEHGSLNILRSGYQTVGGAGAPIPTSTSMSAVPLPASLPLLLVGAGGLLALRRRKTAA